MTIPPKSPGNRKWKTCCAINVNKPRKEPAALYPAYAGKRPKNTVVLTLACGKYRINDLDIGTIGSFPRILDMGQCNDAYGAIQVAVALAGAFKCGVNDLTLVLLWYESEGGLHFADASVAGY